MNIEKRKVYSSFEDIIWVAHFTDMQLINKFNKEFHFSLYVIDICSKYAQKDNKCITVTSSFQKVLDASNR